MGFLGACLSLVLGCGQLTMQVPPPTAGQPALFGMTVNHFAGVKPLVSFGTTRSWDAYPELDWADANPAPGEYNFSQLDSFISINQARGADIIYTLGRTPQWASTQPNAPGPYGPGQCAPPKLAAWDQYVTAVVTNAAGRIKYWELWNEAQDPQFYCGDIATMVTLAQHAYGIIKSIDPSAKVLSPAVVGSSGPTWLASFLAAGGSSVIDIVAFHGYGTVHAEDLIAILNSYRTVMCAANVSSMPLWDTEGSWGDDAIGDDAHRAAFLAKYYLLQWSQGVPRVVWYSYDNDPQWGRLIGTTPQLTAAGTAYQQTYAWAVGATLSRPCAADNNQTWACTLTRPGGYQAQIVWNSTRNLGYQAPAKMADYRDLSGVIHPIANAAIPVGNSPILIEPNVPSY
jgi:hypothetical protein